MLYENEILLANAKATFKRLVKLVKLSSYKGRGDAKPALYRLDRGPVSSEEAPKTARKTQRKLNYALPYIR